MSNLAINVRGVRQLKNSPIIKASNFEFNTETMHATSYRWYDLVKEINGKVILNSYNYSSTTIKHIAKARAILRQLDVVYHEFSAPRGLQDLNAAIEHYENRIEQFQAAIDKPRSQAKANAVRQANIHACQGMINFIKGL